MQRQLARLMPHTARTKILLVFMLVNLAATIAYAAYAWNMQARSVRETVDARLNTAAAALPKIIGYEYLRALPQSGSVPEERYLAMSRLLHDYANKVGVRYLYVFIRDGNTVRYLADGASEEEIRAGNYGRYLSAYTDPPAALFEAFNEREARFAEYRDRWGQFRSVFVPMQREDGSTLIFGADIDLDQLQVELDKALLHALGIGMLTFLAGLIGSLLLARLLAAPIAQLASAAERVAMGDYKARVPIRGNDEVARLGRAFNLMSGAIAEREQEITRLAYIDPLTELPNRVRLAELISEEIQNAQQGEDSVAVIMVDIDRFKYINDYLGYSVGDAALKSIAQRLRQVQRESDHLGRFSGDEFVLVLPGVNRGNLEPVLRRLHSVLENPLAIAGQSIDVAGSTGAAFFPEHGTSAHMLLRQAESAMYMAKRTLANFMVYDAHQEENRKSQLSLLGELKTAIEQHQLVAFYQPKVNLQDGYINSVEALVRWQHPERGWVPPNQFIPFAEQTGKIRSLTLWMLRECMQQSLRWNAAGRQLRVSVNVSVSDMEDPGFVSLVECLLNETGANAQDLCLEITESAVMGEPERVMAALRRLRELGFKLSIDDFGTGYSSLAYLSRLPVNQLKIDRSFILRLHEAEGIQIARAIVQLGHILKLEVVAEGVESAEAWQTVSSLGCDSVQGYLVARPMPQAEFDAWFSACNGRWSLPA